MGAGAERLVQELRRIAEEGGGLRAARAAAEWLGAYREDTVTEALIARGPADGADDLAVPDLLAGLRGQLALDGQDGSSGAERRAPFTARRP